MRCSVPKVGAVAAILACVCVVLFIPRNGNINVNRQSPSHAHPPLLLELDNSMRHIPKGAHAKDEVPDTPADSSTHQALFALTTQQPTGHQQNGLLLHPPTKGGPGSCSRLPKRFIAQFHLNAYLVNLKESVEVQIFNAFGALLDEKCRRYASSLTAPKAGPLGFFVDIGGNNGIDVAFWLKRFGGCDSPCGCGGGSTPSHQGLHFVVFEPQGQYQSLLNGMATKRDAAITKEGGVVRQRPLTVVQAAVGKSSQHDTQLIMVGDGEQAVVKLEEHKEVQVKKNMHIRTSVKIKSLEKVLDGISPLKTTPILALKVDAEGADATILMASSPLFAAGSVDFVIFELNKNVKFFESTYVQATDMLREAGYRTFLVGVNKTGAVNGMLTYIAMEVDGSIFRRLRVSLETMIAVSPSLASLMKGKSSDSSNLFGAVGVNGRQLADTDPLIVEVSPGCYLSAYAWETR